MTAKSGFSPPITLNEERAGFKMEKGVRYDSRPAKRDRMEIVSVIIAITQRPTCLTRIMGRANLSYSLLKNCLSFMLAKNLIEKQDVLRACQKSAPIYLATEKGNKFLELYCEQLILLHGEGFLDCGNSLAGAYLIQYLRKNRPDLTRGNRKHLEVFLPLERELYR
jgi:predicted transcriptional regulator